MTAELAAFDKAVDEAAAELKQDGRYFLGQKKKHFRAELTVFVADAKPTGHETNVRKTTKRHN